VLKLKPTHEGKGKLDSDFCLQNLILPSLAIHMQQHRILFCNCEWVAPGRGGLSGSHHLDGQLLMNQRLCLRATNRPQCYPRENLLPALMRDEKKDESLLVQGELGCDFPWMSFMKSAPVLPSWCITIIICEGTLIGFLPLVGSIILS